MVGEKNLSNLNSPIGKFKDEDLRDYGDLMYVDLASQALCCALRRLPMNNPSESQQSLNECLQGPVNEQCL